MGRGYRRSSCRDCGASGNDTHISKQGLCGECGWRRYKEANAQIASKTGEVYSAYVQGWMRANGGAGRPITPYPPDA